MQGQEAKASVGSGSGSCTGSHAIEPACQGPQPVPWLPHDNCLLFYETRVLAGNPEQRIRFRITFEHCLRLLGRQQGSLLYTLTLLPGEEVKLFEFDRFRRVRTSTERVSVHASFRQTISALSQSFSSSSSSAYADALKESRNLSDSSTSVSGNVLIFGGSSASRDVSEDVESQEVGVSVQRAAERFSRLAVSASQAVDAERSLIVSRFEEAEHQATTSRTFKNDNRCYAVTYFARRVNEVYGLSTRIFQTEWRLGNGPWRVLEDSQGLSAEFRKQLEELRALVLRNGEQWKRHEQISLMTDGCMYETELARCSSCEPLRKMEHLAELEGQRCEARKTCLEAELLDLEVTRRRVAAESGKPEPLELGAWSLDDATRTSPEPA